MAKRVRNRGIEIDKKEERYGDRETDRERKMSFSWDEHSF